MKLKKALKTAVRSSPPALAARGAGVVGKQLQKQARGLKGLWTTNYATPKVTTPMQRRMTDINRVLGRAKKKKS